jgi:hypothetical protein
MTSTIILIGGADLSVTRACGGTEGFLFLARRNSAPRRRTNQSSTKFFEMHENTAEYELCFHPGIIIGVVANTSKLFCWVLLVFLFSVISKRS